MQLSRLFVAHDQSTDKLVEAYDNVEAPHTIDTRSTLGISGDRPADTDNPSSTVIARTTNIYDFCDTRCRDG